VRRGLKFAAAISVAALTIAACGSDSDSADNAGTLGAVESTATGNTAGTEGSGALEPKTIGIWQSSGQAEVQQRTLAAVQAGADALGWTTQVVDGEGDPALMQQRLQALVDSDVDAIVSIFLEPAVVTPQLEAAQVAEIPVLNVGFIGTESPLVAAQYIGDQVQMATLLTERMTEDMPDGGDIGVISLAGFMGVEQRVDYFKDSADANGFTIVGEKEVTVLDLFNGTTKAGTDLLNANPDLTAFFSCCDFGAQALAPALEQAGKDVPVYSFYAIPSVLDLVRAGNAVIVENDEAKTGIMAIDALAAHFASGADFDASVQLGADPIQYTIVDSTNAPEAGAQVFELPDMLAPYLDNWSNQYGI
jgi:ABC-type sugar transport system substrate-binding protein